jgi:rod shape-determining protein MreD
MLLTISFCAAVLLWVIPIRGEIAFWRPPFVLLLLIYWLVREPQRIGVLWAWLSGLLLDLLFGELLGQHALAMSVAAYLVMSQQTRFHQFKIVHQCLMVAATVLVYEMVLLSTRLLILDVYAVTPMLLTVIGSALIWPFMFVALQKLYGEQW